MAAPPRRARAAHHSTVGQAVKVEIKIDDQEVRTALSPNTRPDAEGIKTQIPQPSGEWEPAEVTLHFRCLPSDRLKQWIEEGGDREFLMQVIAGWEGIHDQDGASLDCTDAHREQVVNIPYFAKAAIEAYFRRFDPPKNS